MNSQMSRDIGFEDDQFFNYSYGRYFSKDVLVLCSTLLIAGISYLVIGLSDLSFMIVPGLLFIIIGFLSFLPIVKHFSF